MGKAEDSCCKVTHLLGWYFLGRQRDRKRVVIRKQLEAGNFAGCRLERGQCRQQGLVLLQSRLVRLLYSKNRASLFSSSHAGQSEQADTRVAFGRPLYEYVVSCRSLAAYVVTDMYDAKRSGRPCLQRLVGYQLHQSSRARRARRQRHAQPDRHEHVRVQRACRSYAPCLPDLIECSILLNVRRAPAA